MRTRARVIGVGLMRLTGVADEFGEDRPGLSKPDVLQKILGKAIRLYTLEQRGPEGAPLFDTPGRKAPYTGWIKTIHAIGKVAALGALKDGKPDGLWPPWNEDGRKEEETRYIDGVKLVE